MKNEITTAIAVPAFPKVSPKPTKSEVLDALVERARVKHELDEKSRKIKADALQKKIGKLAFSLIRKENLKQDYIYDHCVRYKIDVKSPELTKLISEYEQVRRGSAFDPVATKRLLREKMAGAPQKSRLLDSPEAVEALDQLLESFS